MNTTAKVVGVLVGVSLVGFSAAYMLYKVLASNKKKPKTSSSYGTDDHATIDVSRDRSSSLSQQQSCQQLQQTHTDQQQMNADGTLGACEKLPGNFRSDSSGTDECSQTNGEGQSTASPTVDTNRSSGNSKSCGSAVLELSTKHNGVGQKEHDTKRSPKPLLSTPALPTSDATVSSEFSRLKIGIPNDMVGAIIGRQGSTIKKLQAETRTKIDLSREGEQNLDGQRIVTIRGREKDIQEAEMRILHIIYSGQASMLSHTIEIPAGSAGKIIGSGGATIKKLQQASDCKIKVVCDRYNPTPHGTVTFTGSDKAIASALHMVEQLVEEYEAQRSKVMTSKTAQPRQPRQYTQNNFNHDNSGRTSAVVITPPQKQWPTHGEYVEVYVSATENPAHIWVQIISPEAYQMEETRERMTEYYSSSVNLVDYLPIVGDYVAALSPIDGFWYRGRVAKKEEGNVYDIYFIDYGDSDWLMSDKIQPLRPQFCEIHTQAVECYTVAINYTDITEWSESTCDRFEQLSHTGKWVVLQAQAQRWHTRASDGVKLPVLRLVDTNGDEDVDIIVKLYRELRAERGDSTLEDVSEVEYSKALEFSLNDLESSSNNTADIIELVTLDDTLDEQ